MNSPVLLCGLGRVGWRVLDCLRSAGIPVIVVDTSADPADPRLLGVRLVRGDCRQGSVLIEAGLREVRGVLIVTSDDLLNISCALLIRRLAPDVRIVLRMFNQNLVARLGKAVSNVSALSVSALSAPLLALTATTGEVLATIGAAAERRQVAEVTVSPDSPLIGRSVANLDDQNRILLLAHTPLDLAPRVLFEMDRQATIGPGDRLVVAGQPADVGRILHSGRDDRSEVLWAGHLRRMGRVALRTIAEMDLAVKVCAIAMVLVVLSSAAVYHYGLGHSWADGVYQTISVVASGSDLGGKEYEGWGKVFVSGLRIFGTVVVAAFTAIFTNYLIRARLGGVFEVRRIPDSGHVVVIGLGNVGYRVVEELTKLGERPVVVERSGDNPFIASCRRAGVPVIIGDATLRESLHQARVDKARAVIAATSADLANLEIALLVSEINDKQRVVVRLADSVLADTARTAAGVKMAVSLPELAAPAFVANVLGDRVLSMFLIGGRILAVVETEIQADDTAILGQTIRALSIDYRTVLVSVIRSNGEQIELEPDYRLSLGDRVIAVVTVPDLDRLTRRVSVANDWSIEVLAFPLSLRDELVRQVRARRNLSLADAENVVAGAPFLMADRKTRGQAEDLLSQLHREKVTARILQDRADSVSV